MKKRDIKKIITDLKLQAFELHLEAQRTTDRAAKLRDKVIQLEKNL